MNGPKAAYLEFKSSCWVIIHVCTLQWVSDTWQRSAASPSVKYLRAGHIYDTIVVKYPTTCEKYTFWNVFFISPTDMAHMFHIAKQRKTEFYNRAMSRPG